MAHDLSTGGASAPSTIGVVVHPARDIAMPLGALERWAEEHGTAVVQIPVPGQDRRVAPPAETGEADLVVSIGGDGTMLAAIRAAAAGDRPVLGVSCGSLGALTTVAATALPAALTRFAAGDWVPRHLPALTVVDETGSERFALNDLAVVRGGIGQVRVIVSVDDTLFSRLAGDGCIVATPIGSSAYSLAAGGPLLVPDADAFLITPLPTHGGSHLPLVVGARSEVRLDVTCGLGGARLEIDGQVVATDPSELEIRFRPAVATIVKFAGQEPLFTSLRRRRIIVDSPRLVADEEHAASHV